MAEDKKAGADERVVPDRIREDAVEAGAPVVPEPRRRGRVPLVVGSVCAACVLALAVGGFALGAASQEGAAVDLWASTTVPVREVSEASSLDDYLAEVVPAAGEGAEEPAAEEPAAEKPDAPSSEAPATPPASDSSSAGSGGGQAAQPPASSGGAGSSGGSSSGGTAETPSAPPAPDPKPQTITVTISVDGSKAKPSGYSVGLGSRSVTLPEGATVYDALKATGLAIGGSASYVSSIGGLAEFSCGAGSGWMYGVNGSYPKKACNAYKLSSGDSVRWVYTLDNGNDV